MTIEIPAGLVPQVEAFITEVAGGEPVDEATKKIAVVALLQRGLRATEEMKQRKGETP